MNITQAFQAVAHNRGFVALEKSGDKTISWLRKRASVTDNCTDQRMCIDSLTNSATVFWILQGRVNSKTFRRVLALQQWLEQTTSIE
jgi:hypothetical protein